jgi:hypothetical protein
MEHDPVVQRYRAFFALLDWSVVPQPPIDPSRPGKRPHPQSAYVKALLLKIEEGFTSCTHLRRFLVEHPLLVLELGFRPILNRDLPYGFDVGKTVPTARWLREQQHLMEQPVLQALLAATVRDLREEIPGLGEVVAFDVTPIYAFVKENNLRAYVKERYNKDRQPAGDRDCKLGVKKSTNKEQADGSTKKEKEYLWGYGSGVASAFVAGYGEVVLAENTLTFNENDISYFVPLAHPLGGGLGLLPHPSDRRCGFRCLVRVPDGSSSRWHRGHPAQLAWSSRLSAGSRWRAALCQGTAHAPHVSVLPHRKAIAPNAFVALCSFLSPTARPATTRNLPRATVVSKISTGNWVDRCASSSIGTGRSITPSTTSAPVPSAIPSQSKELGIKRPKVRTIDSIRTLNRLPYLVINARARPRVRRLNVGLLSMPVKMVA